MEKVKKQRLRRRPSKVIERERCGYGSKRGKGETKGRRTVKIDKRVNVEGRVEKKKGKGERGWDDQ